MELGVFVYIHEGTDIEHEFQKLADNGFSTCQINIWAERYMTDRLAQQIREASVAYGIRITAFWCGWGGPSVWNFHEGPATLGLVPAAYRQERIRTLKKGSDFARSIHVNQMITHIGFIPENPASEEYGQVVSAIREVAEYCRENGQYFLFETGQETPITLRRTIEDVGTGNLGINLDPANLIMYGKGNPVDALEVFGEYVRDVHGKDGEYPTNGRELGVEKPIGEGRVNYPALIAGLKRLGYDGPITIEREISGEEQQKDILQARAYLLSLIREE